VDGSGLRGRVGSVKSDDFDSSEPLILKLGGSLLDLWNLGDLLQWFGRGRRVLIVPGGGEAADTVRRLDVHGFLTTEQSHWMAIEAMSFNAGVLRRTLPVLSAADGLESTPWKWPEGRPLILDAAGWLMGSGSAVSARIPASWDATSDSIAAIVAAAIGVESLILGKSCEPCSVAVADLAAAGQVDTCFPGFAGKLKLAWCNFRATSPKVRCVGNRDGTG